MKNGFVFINYLNSGDGRSSSFQTSFTGSKSCICEDTENNYIYLINELKCSFLAFCEPLGPSIDHFKGVQSFVAGKYELICITRRAFNIIAQHYG